jgi:DNA-binding CsgD family transcriptional regulator
MPDRAGSTRSKDAVIRPGHCMNDGVPEQDDITSRWARLRWMRPRIVERDPGEPRRFDYGDLLEGSVAVAALLLMVAIGMTPWLAIPLSVVTYIAVALLRPERERPDERIDGTAAGLPSTEEMAEDRGHKQVPNAALTGVDTVVARFGLTRREQEILPLLAQRLTDREIAERLSISHRTAMNHTANILGKLGLASRRDIAAFVTLHALQPPSTPPREPE